MDKLGLLSLQVPILANSTETADGGSSVFMAAAEALPTRYVSPDIDAATAAADVGPGEHGQVQGEAGSVASSFAAADSSSSCSSCFWEDNSSSRDSSGKGAGNAVVTGVNYWISCSETTSAPKFEAKRSVGVSPRLLMSETQGESEWQQATPETQLKGPSACAAAAAGLAAVSTAAEQKEEGKGWDPVATRREEESVQDINMKDDCLGIGAASVERCSTDEPHAPANNGDGSASQDDVNSPAHAARAASIEMAAVAPPKAPVLDAAVSSKPDKRPVEDSAALHAAVAGSCTKVKGGSADDSVCGTGTPTTRFSTEQEEDGAAAPAIAHRDAVLGGAAAGSGPEAEERGGLCSSSDGAEMLVSGEVATQPLSYEKPPPSEGVQLHGADAAAAAAEETEVGDMDADQQQAQGGDGTTVTAWHHGTQEGKTDVGETQTQQQPIRQADASLPDSDSFLRDDVAVGNLLAAAAAVVEQHVHALSAGIGAVDSQKGPAGSEETQVATTRTATDESLERAATVLPNDMACLDGAEGLCDRTAKGYGAAGRSSGGLAACVKSERPGPGSQTSETMLSLTPALGTTLLEASHEAGILPSSTSSTSSEERSGATAAETRERDEGTGGQGHRGKKQTPSGERVVASQALPDDGTRGAAPGTPGGGGGRAVGTRGAAGASQQQQQTNGSSGCAAALPEDPELVESLKSLLRALPRKKDAEAKWLLSGEMPFVRPYALQIVDVWKIHLGEAGRTALKKDISERTQADASLKKQVLAICKLKMAKLEVLVQIAEVADLLPRTLQIANDYEVDRQVASVTRQSASRRALSAAVTASSSQHSSVSSHSNSYYAGSNACDVSAAAGGSSSHPSTVGTGTGRMSSSSAQIGVSTRHSASSFSPSRASLSAGASPPAERSPRGHRLDAPSPGSHNVCRASVLLSPRAGTGAGGTTSADEYASISDERSRFCYKGSPSAKENSGSNSSSPTAAVYESREESACSRPEGLSVASLPRSTACGAAERNGGARIRSPRASSESRYHFVGVPGSPEDSGDSSRQLQHLQQQHQQQHMHGLQQHQRERAHQQPLCGSGEEEARCSEAEVNFVAHDLRETLNLLQQGGARMHPGRDALPLPSSAAKLSSSRSERMSPSKEWTERMDLTRVPELQQGSTKKKLMLPQPRHSQQAGNYVEKDEDAIRAAELLAAFAELRSEISSGSHANQQAATDISTSSTMAHDDLLNVTLEAAAAGVVTSPRARALIAALSDSHRLARIPELPGFPCLDRDDNSDEGVRRRPQEHEVLTLLRLAGLSGDEAAATAFAGQLLCAAAQGSTSNSSSSSEAEGAPLQELDCEVGPADLQTVRRKRARRSNKSGVRSNNRNRSAANSREVRVDENHHHALQLQQLHQQLQQQQLLQAQETGNDLPAALAGERQTCMSMLEPAVAAGKEDVLRGAEKPNCKKKRSCQTSGEDSKLQGQDPTQDEDTEEEDGSQVKTGGGAFSRVPEAAALLQSVDRSQGRYPSAGHPAAGDCTEGSSGGVSATTSGSQSDNGCKGTFPPEHDDDRFAKVASARENALPNAEKGGNSGGAAEARTSSKGAGVRLSRRTEEEVENGGGNGTARCSEERTTAADAAEERTTDVAGRSAGTRPAVRSDVDLESRSSTASRSLSRNGIHRCNSGADGFPGASSENSSCNRGRNGVRQGRENLWGAAPYTTRRSAAAAAGAGAVEGGDSGFTEAAKSGSSNGGSNNGGSRLAARGVTQGEIDGKVSVLERHEIEGGSGRGPGDSVAEQCAREAKQLLERALKVNDALGFVPASCRLTISGTPRDHEASNGGSNSGTGTRAKRAREQISAGEWDTGAFLQVLATVCLMYLKAMYEEYISAHAGRVVESTEQIS